jgi:hypothetical protein
MNDRDKDMALSSLLMLERILILQQLLSRERREAFLYAYIMHKLHVITDNNLQNFYAVL